MAKMRVQADKAWDIDRRVIVSNYPEDPENIYLELYSNSDEQVFSWQKQDFYAPKWEPHGDKSTAILPYAPDLLTDLEKDGYTLDLTNFDKSILDVD